MLFLPRDGRAAPPLRADLLAEAIEQDGLKVLGWRDVPTDNRCLGDIARGGRAGHPAGVHRRRRPARTRNWSGGCTSPASGPSAACAQRSGRSRPSSSTSPRCPAARSSTRACSWRRSCSPTIPTWPTQRVVTALAIVHQRYSTNTFPSWRLAQPFRMIAHNGEINTLRGNAQPPAGLREDDGLPGAWPRTCRTCSRSSSRAAATRPVSTTCMELLVRAGRSAPHALMMMIPEAFGPSYHISTDKRAFYEYHAAIMEPWDGPAAMVFTDGRLVGGTLDRNGLRPCRYVVTTDGLVVLASEVGVIEFPPEQIQQKGRLQPGRMFLVDTEEGRIVVDNEIKGKIARQKPYRRWLEENRIELRGLFQPSKPHADRPGDAGPAAAGVRLHARRAADDRWRRWPPTARSRSARWAPTRRWPCSPTGRSCCSTTSSSSSPR